MGKTTAIIGSGRIGCGWAARFLLSGWHVRVFDPDPGTEARLSRVIERARASLPGLYDTPPPPPGRLSLHASLSEAVAGANWIQESAPDRLELKRKVFQAVQAACDPEALIASSSAGLSAEALQGCAMRPAQILVATPMHPVYLIPVVELEAGPAGAELLARATSVLEALGMEPAAGAGAVRARLQAALWREAQACVADGAATQAQIDQTIRSGPGLLWAQMGPFEAQRLDGATGLDMAGPEAQRDAALVGLLRALKAEGRGAGAALAAADRVRAPSPGAETAPLLTAARVVPLDWADYNGHMTEARYLHAFGNATDRFMELIGVDAEYLASGGSFFTAETHIRHLEEMRIGAGFEIRTTCLDGAGKRMHLWHEMRCDGRLVATGEHMLIHVSLETRRPAPPVAPVAENLARIAQAHARLARAEGVGRAIGDPR